MAKNTQKTRHFKARGSFFLVLVIVMFTIILIPLASGFEFDNKKTYDKDAKTITIKNSILGIIPTNEIATATLKTQEDIWINVQEGVDEYLVGEIEINLLLDDYENFFKQLDFYNLRNGNVKVNKNYVLKKKIVTGTTTEDVFENVCSESGQLINGTQKFSCKPQKTGTKEVEVYHWEDINSLDLAKGNITIGIFMNVNLGDKIEWIPTLFGVEINEWTTFVGASLIAYNHPSVTGSSNVQVSQYNAASFSLNTTQNTWYVVGAAAQLYKSGTPELNINFSLWDTSSEVPNSQLGGNFTMNTSVIGSTSSPGELFNFTLPGIEVTNGTRYALVEMSAAIGANNNVEWVFEAYGSGIDVTRYIFSGGTWQSAETKANGFELWATTSAPTGVLNVTTTLNSPADEEDILNTSVEFNASATVLFEGDPANLTNMTLYLYNSSASLIDSETDIVTGNSTNQTLFDSSGLSLGTYTWNVLSCVQNSSSSLCNFANNNRTFDISIIKLITESYNNFTTEGLQNDFSANFLTNGEDVTSAQLIYNNTANSATINNHGNNNYTLTRTVTSPLVAADTNVSFYWNVTQDTITSTTPQRNQTVLNIGIDGCDSFSNLLYNFTVRDEETQVRINGSTGNTLVKIDLQLFGNGTTANVLNFSKNYTATNQIEVCVNNNLSTGEQYQVDLQAQYQADNYETELYNLQNSTISAASFPTHTSLYDLNSSDAQAFQISFRDASFLPVEDALIQVQRKYIDEGVFRIVELPITDAKGQTVAHLVLNDVIYTFRIIKYGETLATFNDVLAVCQNPLVTPCEISFNALSGSSSIPDFEEAEDFSFTLGYNSSSRVISSVFDVPSGASSNITLEVIKEDALGTSVCTNYLISSSGTLSCVVPGNFGNATVLAKLYKDGDLQAQGNVKIDQNPSDIYGGVLVMLALFVMLTLIGAGMSDNPIVTVLFFAIGVIVLFALNLVANNGFIGATATILWLLVAIVLLLIKGGKRN